jgi:magnesium-transporting ATPase (P-type)
MTATTDKVTSSVPGRSPLAVDNPHAEPVAKVLAALDTTPSGLTLAEAARRLAVFGPNTLPRPPRRSASMRFLAQFDNVLIYVLLASAAVTALLGHAADTAVILAVVLANAVIGYVQEGRAEEAMEAIRQMLSPVASAIREGVRHAAPAGELVPGDIVVLEAGNKVPADLRLIEAHGLLIDEAILTGESVPAEKRTRAVAVHAALGDRTSMAFSGTLVAAGHAKGVVVATGKATEIGRISGMLAAVEVLTTPLVAQMAVFAKWLTFLILLVAALILAWGALVRHYDFEELFMTVVGLSVAAIPEGLPAVLTVTLAIGVRAMAKRNAIVRRLPAIEALGSVSVICTDKTGTLTRNEMTVATVATAGDDFTVTGDGRGLDGDIRRNGEEVDPPEHPALMRLAEAAALCNDASLVEKSGIVSVDGDPMEGALLVFARKVGFGHEHGWVRRDAIPFDARHRFMATLNRHGDGRVMVFVKGAPEKILGMCSGELGPDGVAEPLDANLWHREAHKIADSGERVLALAAREAPDEPDGLGFDQVDGGLTLLGLVGLIDPPRPEAIAAVAECRAAGIDVKMITGDHARTAVAIGRLVGLESTDRVVTGAEIDAQDDAWLRQVARDADVFARTSPEHKLRLVAALQSRGEVVAMTGDGVNDAPALKRADAGIAMGRKGSEVAREAAELVLADDNFASIVAAVREGRTVYDNLKKVISWTLPTNFGEAATIVAALLLGLTLPMTAVQILWVNLITAATLGIALAFEPTEPNAMRRPPRPRDEPLVGGQLVWHIVLVGGLILAGVFGMFSYAIDRGYPVELARTIAVNTIVVMEVFHLFFVRNIYGTSLTLRGFAGTPAVWISVGVIVVAQFAITYVPFLQGVFGTADVPFLDGVAVVGVGIALFAILEVEKQIRLLLTRPREPARR